MKLSLLQELPSSRQLIDVFGGYNHNLRISEGEFYDMKNLTGADYPVLSPRPQRGIYSAPDNSSYSNAIKITNPIGMLEKDSLCYVDCVTENHLDGARLYINGNEVEDFTLSSRTADLPKRLVSMGAYVIILPDKKYVNTTDYSDKGKIEAVCSFSAHPDFPNASIEFSLCKSDGEAYNAPTSASEPKDPADGDLWIDSREKPYALKQYSASGAQWVSIATTYVRITLPVSWIANSTKIVSKLFQAGDGITISGIPLTGEGEQYEELAQFNSTMVAHAVTGNSIVVTGIISQNFQVSAEQAMNNGMAITRLMPQMDFIIENQNRLWGCRYGLDNYGNFVNEIYASKLGDFKNWNSYAGISTDSYAATMGTDGQFTGAITHLGYPIFFKENCMHKVYGNYPANYQIQTVPCRGVQKGCDNSLTIVNEVLYYKARSAVCMYDGSLPTEISSALGDVSYSEAVAGAVNNKLYISMKDDATNEYHLFTFDTKRGLWHKEDNTKVTQFCTCRGNLYYIDATDKKIKTTNVIPGVSDPDTSVYRWMAESGIIGTDSPDKKYISRLDVRMMLTVGTRVNFYIEYDSCGRWEHLFTMTGMTLKSFAVPIRPRRCDHMRIRIEGDGEAKIFSICKTIEQGSDI